MEEGIIKKLMTSLKCDTCGKHYEPFDVQILGHRSELWFFRVNCSNCQTACLIAVSVKESALADAINDLTATELGEFSNANIVGSDDLIDMHNFLKDFHGDFTAMFRKG